MSERRSWTEQQVTLPVGFILAMLGGLLGAAGTGGIGALAGDGDDVAALDARVDALERSITVLEANARARERYDEAADKLLREILARLPR